MKLEVAIWSDKSERINLDAVCSAQILFLVHVAREVAGAIMYG